MDMNTWREIWSVLCLKKKNFFFWGSQAKIVEICNSRLLCSRIIHSGFISPLSFKYWYKKGFRFCSTEISFGFHSDLTCGMAQVERGLAGDYANLLHAEQWPSQWDSQPEKTDAMIPPQLCGINLIIKPELCLNPNWFYFTLHAHCTHYCILNKSNSQLWLSLITGLYRWPEDAS